MKPTWHKYLSMCSLHRLIALGPNRNTIANSGRRLQPVREEIIMGVALNTLLEQDLVCHEEDDGHQDGENDRHYPVSNSTS